jgi:tetratricopeptide (TPR) repeat protein
MSINLEFEVDDESLSGMFHYGGQYERILKKLDSILEKYEDKKIDTENYREKLEDLIRKFPKFIDVHAHLGHVYTANGEWQSAVSAYEQGLAICHEVIPPEFSGLIKWSWHQNRPFLRAAHGLALCYSRMGKHRPAIKMMEKILGWDPGDHLGVRYIIGSEYLRVGATRKAAKSMEKCADTHPPYQYELALMEWLAGRKVSAATWLRRAFISNIYIAEILCGNSSPMPLTIWTTYGSEDTESAREYVNLHGSIWYNDPEIILFIRWLSMQSRVLRERSQIYEIKEDLVWERDIGRRTDLLHQEKMLLSQIDDHLSAEIVTDRLDRHGRPISPWLFPVVRPKWPG